MKKITLLTFIAIVAVISMTFHYKNFERKNQTDKESKIKNIKKEEIITEQSQRSLLTPGRSTENFQNYSYEKKIDKEKELNRNAIEELNLPLASGKALYNSLIKRGARIDSDIADRIKNEKITEKDWEYLNSYVAQLMDEEENFKLELTQYRSLDELKKSYSDRSKSTGIFYGNEILGQSITYKKTSLDDIRDILNAGAVLPDDVMQHIVDSGNLDLALELKNSGFNIKVDYFNEFTSMNIMEMQSEKIAINPFMLTSEEQVSSFEKIIQLGGSIKVADGTRDAADILLAGAISHDADESEKLLKLVSYLNNRGLFLEKSHFELLEQLKKKHPQLHERYSPLLK